MTRKINIITHLSAWVILFIIFPLLLYIDSFYDDIFLKRSLFQFIILIILFYLNYFFLIPKLFFKNKKLEYYVSIIFTILLFVFIFNQFDNYIGKPTEFKNSKQCPNENLSHENFLSENHDLTISNQPSIPDFRIFPRPSKKWPLYNFLLISLLISGFSLGLRLSE